MEQAVQPTNFTKLLCYLNKEAREAFEKLVASGVDNELAFTMVESLGGEEVYELNSDDGFEDSDV